MFLQASEAVHLKEMFEFQLEERFSLNTSGRNGQRTKDELLKAETVKHSECHNVDYNMKTENNHKQNWFLPFSSSLPRLPASRGNNSTFKRKQLALR